MYSKEIIEMKYAHRLLNFGPVVLVTSKSRDNVDVSTVSWCMPVSYNPFLVAVAFTKKRFTYELIHESREFVINIPTASMSESVLACGQISGRETDKFTNTGLSCSSSQKLDTPFIDECIAHLECKVTEEISTGDHMLIIGDVISATAALGVFDQNGAIDIDEVKPLLHLGADRFATLAKL